MRGMERVVIGVDGSERSMDALRWAERYCEKSGASLDVVMAWERLNPDAWIPHVPGGDPLVVTRAALEEIVTGVKERCPTLTVESHAVEGAAGPKLLEAAQGADLLVVGNRGRGGFAGLLLGSVGQYLTTHAPCAVVVVRGAVPAA